MWEQTPWHPVPTSAPEQFPVCPFSGGGFEASICSSSLIACPPGKDASRRDTPRPPPLLRVDETLREVANDGDLSGFGVSELRSLLGGSWWLCHWRDPRKHPWRVLGVFTRVTTAPSSWVWLLNLRAATLMWARFPSLEIWLADRMLGGREARRWPSARLAGDGAVHSAPAEPTVA